MSSKIKSSLSSEEKERVITNVLFDLYYAIRHPETPSDQRERLALAEHYKRAALALFEYSTILRCTTEWTSGCDLIDPRWIKSERNKAHSNLVGAIGTIKDKEKGMPGSGPFAGGYGRWKHAVEAQDWRYLIQISSNILVTSTHLRSRAEARTKSDDSGEAEASKYGAGRGHPKKDRELDVLKRALEKGVSETDVLRAIKQDPPAESDGYAFRGMARHYLLQTIKTKHPDDDVAETLRNRWKSARNRRKLAGKHGTKIEK